MRTHMLVSTHITNASFANRTSRDSRVVFPSLCNLGVNRLHKPVIRVLSARASSGNDDKGDPERKNPNIIKNVANSPDIKGNPPSPPKPNSITATDGNGDGWPSFVPEILRLNRGDVITVVIAFGVSYVIRWGIAEPRYIPSLSMYPCFDIGDRLIAEKITYRFNRPPMPGDVVIFHPADGVVPKRLFGEEVFIKRIVAVEGDTVEVKNKSLIVNGVKRDEPFLLDKPEYNLDKIEVPPKHIFVLGDNRNNSYDSHLWGPLPVENVLGRACFIYWPLKKWGTLPDYSMYEAPLVKA